MLDGHLQGPPGLKGASGPGGSPGSAVVRLCPQGEQGGPGQKGSKGDKGEAGEDGEAGDPGPVGIPGRLGPIGLTGDLGQQGEAGPNGALGLEGPIGKTGPRGSQGHPGKPGPQGLRGIPGPAVRDYWIDPNQGCHRDAFKAFCNFTAQGETCLYPDKKFQSFSYSASDGVSIHIVQLTFLKLLSATAKQTFTYHCLNSAAWLHTATYSHEHALRFRGSSGEELTHENTHYVSALYDGCQVSDAVI
ncbi:hypothetical protein GOODEAATRI_003593 [Goodea atripinnis]|uniref:Fibrillar collagen NC1 domain-containing protein n=1 Tax=Goodea atripinnis TaxID=208336 RepID=A0ABV0N7L4_9TELE